MSTKSLLILALIVYTVYMGNGGFLSPLILVRRHFFRIFSCPVGSLLNNGSWHFLSKLIQIESLSSRPSNKKTNSYARSQFKKAYEQQSKHNHISQESSDMIPLPVNVSFEFFTISWKSTKVLKTLQSFDVWKY